jgi:hypothetical protein
MNDTYHPDHVRENLNAVEHLSVVDTNHAANHLRHDDHVAKVSLDAARSLAGDGFLLRLSQAGDESLWLPLQTAEQSSACASRVEANQLVHSQVKQRLKLNSSVLELLERALLLQSCRLVLLRLVDVLLSVFFVCHLFVQSWLVSFPKIICRSVREHHIYIYHLQSVSIPVCYPALLMIIILLAAAKIKVKICCLKICLRVKEKSTFVQPKKLCS